MFLDNFVHDLVVNIDIGVDVSDTYKYILLLYLGFIISVVLVNVISLLVNALLKYRLNKLIKNIEYSK